MWRDGQRGKRVRAREQQNEEGAISPFYSVMHTWLLPGNWGGVELRPMLAVCPYKLGITAGMNDPPID